MKKILAILLAAVLLLSFAACSKTPDNGETTEADSETSVTEETYTELSFDHITDDETVAVTLPSVFFSEDSPASDELTDEQKAQGFESATINEDGSLTYTIKGSSYKTLMPQMTQQTREGMDELTENFKCVKEVKYNGDFTRIDIYVDLAEFQADPFQNAAIFMQIELDAEVYQAFALRDYADWSIDVTLYDADSGENLVTSHYPKTE